MKFPLTQKLRPKIYFFRAFFSIPLMRFSQWILGIFFLSSILWASASDTTASLVSLKSIRQTLLHTASSSFFWIGMLLIFIIFIIFMTPYLICRKITRIIPSLLKKELWWPVFLSYFLAGFTQQVFRFFFARTIFSENVLSESLSEGFTLFHLSTLEGIALLNTASFVIFYAALYWIIRWLLTRSFVENEWTSRGVVLVDLQKSIRKGIVSSFLIQWLIIVVLFALIPLFIIVFSR